MGAAAAAAAAATLELPLVDKLGHCSNKAGVIMINPILFCRFTVQDTK